MMMKIMVPLNAWLEIDPKSFKDLPIQNPDELKNLIFELLQGEEKVKIPIGKNEIKGTIKYIVPNPREINDARIKHRDKT